MAADNAPAELLRNRALWQSHRFKNYSYQLHFLGYIPLVGEPPAVAITVRHGKIVRAVLLGAIGKLAKGSSAPVDNYASKYIRLTIDQLFQKIEEVYSVTKNSPNVQISVSYNENYGYPTTFSAGGPEVLHPLIYNVSNFKDFSVTPNNAVDRRRP